jgi:hypothetical protein
MAESRFTPASSLSSFSGPYLTSHLFHANFVDLSAALKKQIEKRDGYWSRGIFYNQVQFTLVCNSEWRAHKGTFVTCPGQFWFGLVGTNFGSFISFPKNIFRYPRDFWLKTMPDLFENACRQMVVLSVHDC